MSGRRKPIFAPSHAHVARRIGMSLMEVIVGMTLATMLLIPMVGLLKASGRIWRQFESGHSAIAVRQAAIQEIQLRMDGATRLLATNGRQVRFLGKAGDNQRIYQLSTSVYWQHGTQDDLIAEGVGSIQFRQLARGATPEVGELVEIRVGNRSGANVANAESVGVVWVKPTI